MSAAARAVIVSSTARAAVESYEDAQEQRAAVRAAKRLTEHEAEDLRYLWDGYAADLGIRSLHASIEHRLLMAPPRDVQTPVLEELVERQHGRAPEGRIIRIVSMEGLGTRREIRDAIRLLSRPSRTKGPRVERIPVERPDTPKTCEVRKVGRACRHPCSACEWTGFDLVATERGELRLGLSLRSTYTTPEEARRAKWRRQDEAIERGWQTIATHPASEWRSPQQGEETLSNRKRARVDRATAALSRLTWSQASVLQCIFGYFHTSEDAELAAIRRLHPGITVGKARSLRDDACEAYRVARSAG